MRAVAGIACRRGPDEPVDGRGDAGDQRGGGRNVVVEVLVGDLQRARSLERRGAGQQLEEHHAAGVDVSAGIGDPARHLLGGQVGDGAEQQPGRGGQRGGVDRAGQPEIAHLHRAVVRDQHVLGLHVTVDEAGAVRGGERLEHRKHDCQRVDLVEAAGLA